MQGLTRLILMHRQTERKAFRNLKSLTEVRLRLRTHCSEPEDDGCGDTDGGHESVCASVVACVNASPVLEPAEHVLDLVALSVEGLVVVDLELSVGLGRNAGRDPALGEGLAEPVGAIALVAEQGLGLGEGVDY